MDMKNLLCARPKTASADDVAAALAAAKSAAARAAEEELALITKRGEMLISAAPEEVAAAEEALASIRTERERLAAMLPALEAQLLAAQRRSFHDETCRMIAEVEAADRDFGTFIAEAYPVLARRLVEGLALERKAEELREALRARLPEMTPDERKLSKIPDRPSVWPHSQELLGSLVRLPDVQQAGGNEWPLWPVRQ